MQSVSSDYDVMARGSVRYPAQRFFVSWDKAYQSGASFFTIGSSTIGGPDVIKGTGSTVAESDKYLYTEETSNVMLVEYDREFVEPLGSVSRAIADILLDNNDQRFTPGSDATIGAYILPKRPLRLHLGFNLDIDEFVQTFVGEIAEYPELMRNQNLVRLHCRDFFDTIWNTPLQNSVMYQDARSDEVIESLLQVAGLSSGQYDLDTGVNTIGFAYFKKGEKLGPIIQKICEAELGRFYLDETGLYRFENRQSWLSVTTPVLTIAQSMVKREEIPHVDKIVNVAEVTASPREVKSNQLIWQTSIAKEIKAGETIEFFANYDDPVTGVDTPSSGGATSYFSANTASDGTGGDITAQITRDSWTNFGQSSKGVFTNNSSSIAYLTVVVWGTPARVTSEISIRYQDDDSVDTYGEAVATIDNDFIQSQEFAQTLAQILVTDRKEPGDYRELTIKGYPPLQLGDLVSWQSENYNILRIRGRFSATDGLVQTLTLVKRTIQEYFTIGVSDIGGDAQIAP